MNKGFNIGDTVVCVGCVDDKWAKKEMIGMSGIVIAVSGDNEWLVRGIAVDFAESLNETERRWPTFHNMGGLVVGNTGRFVLPEELELDSPPVVMVGDLL